MTLLNLIEHALFNIFRVALSSEEYELHVVLTDKNGIVIHEETKVFQEYRFSDVQWLIGQIKELGCDKDGNSRI